MNKTHLKKYRARRVETDLSIRKHLREKQGRLRRARKAFAAADLLAGDFVSPGGEAFLRAQKAGALPLSQRKARP